MSTEQNKLLVRRQFEEIRNAGNWATARPLPMSCTPRST
jgi:hypothetical protein